VRVVGVHVSSSKGLPSVHCAVIDGALDGPELIAQANWSADPQASEAHALANLQRWLVSRLPDDAPDVLAVKLADYFFKSRIDANVVARTRAEGVVLSVADMQGVRKTITLLGKQIADAMDLENKDDAMRVAADMFDGILDVEAVAVALAALGLG
jgi:hypothetical protein